MTSLTLLPCYWHWTTTGISFYWHYPTSKHIRESSWAKLTSGSTS